jgi:hypothetical protein
MAKYIRAIAAINLQKMSSLLQSKECWAFSIAIDATTKHGISFIGVRLPLHAEGEIQNFHLLAIPLYERHTGSAIADLFSRVLSTLCPRDWTKNLIGISTDGAANMTGHVSGFVTLLTAKAFPGIFRIWCGAHQLDLVIQNLMMSLSGDEFYTTLTGLIGHLHRQQNLAEISFNCPTIASSRWLSLVNV